MAEPLGAEVSYVTPTLDPPVALDPETSKSSWLASIRSWFRIDERAKPVAGAKYRPDVDGLRAVAVIPVLLFHGGIALLSGGFVGVDIFFVISGFVIATKLMEDLEEKKYSIGAFYIRRIRRIIPALIATILVSYVAALFLFLPDAMRNFSQSVVATTTFVSNLFFWKSSGYFETAALDRPLLHTWSLAIEEQFYLVIPLLLLAAFRYCRRHLWLLFSLIAAASLALSIFATNAAPTANFFLLPTRAWELLLGVLIAIAPRRAIGNWLVCEVLALLGLGLIVYSIVAYTDATPFPGLSALVPTAGAAILIAVGRERMTLVGRVLSWPPVIGIGLISFSLYLIHWPIIVFTRYALLRAPTTEEVGLIVIASIALAYLSWRFIEAPFRHPKKSAGRAPRKGPVFAVTAAVLAIVTVLGGVGAATGGFNARFPDYRSARAAEVAADIWLSGRCFLENQDPSAWKGDVCVRTSGAARNALLWGDSFAAQYIPGLIKNASSLSRNIVQYTFAGCPPILTYESYARPGCHGFNENVFSVIDKYAIDTVVLSARWDELRQRGLDGLDATVARLKAKGLKVYVIGQSPMFDFDVAVLDYRGAGKRGDGGASWFLGVAPGLNAQLRAAAGEANFVDPLPAFCREHTCDYKQAGRLLFNDYGHFSDQGSDLAVRSYFPLFAGAASTQKTADVAH